MKEQTKLTEIESSIIEEIVYTNDAILELQFKGGARYQYTEVPIEEFFSLRESESKGKHFIQNIKDKFDTIKL
tara:strand:- start:163 stop:381 length:219 start_codon:yes stop_codon:yes gene_type:complete